MKRLERYLHILVFVLQCGGIVPVILRSGDDLSDLGAANPANTLATAVILGLTFVLLLRHGRAAIRLLPGMRPIVMLVLLALASISWSDYPDVTLRRAGSLVTVALWAWYLAARYDLKDIVAIVRDATGLLALASLAIGVAAPGIGGEDPMGPAGWRGIFANKNDLGMVMALGTITYFYSLCAGGQKFNAFARQLADLLCLQRPRSRAIQHLPGRHRPRIVLCLVIKLTHKRVGVAIISWTSILLLLAPRFSSSPINSPPSRHFSDAMPS